MTENLRGEIAFFRVEMDEDLVEDCIRREDYLNVYDRITRQLAEAQAELAALKAAMVKPLEWRQLRDHWFDAEAIGERIEVYRQTTHWVWEYDDGPSDSYKTCDEAKAAAQAHYAARILSALNIAPQEQENKQ